MDKANKIKNLLPEIEKDELKKFTSIGVGGASDCYIAKSIADLMKAVSVARKVGLPYRVIGNGTNVLFSDRGFDGLVIINRAQGISVDVKSGSVIVESGLPLMRLVLETAAKGLTGLEPLYGIPGTTGGAIIVNCGAHGVAIGDFVRSATVMISSEKIVSCGPDWFKFGYRQSKLKYIRSDSPPVILSIILQLQHRKVEDTTGEIAKYQRWREEHQPVGQKTSGSVFRNPKESDVTQSEDEKFKSAGYLLDCAGAKGLRVGGASVSKKHANWIINSGQATAEDVRSLIEKMREMVEEKYHLTLTEEVEYLGDWN